VEANILKGIRFALHWSCSAFWVLAFLGVLLFAQTTKEPIEVCGGAKGRLCTCTRRIDRLKSKIVDDCEQSGVSSIVCRGRVPADDCTFAEWGEQTEKQPDMGDYCRRVCKIHDCKCGDKATCHVMHKASDHEKPKGTK